MVPALGRVETVLVSLFVASSFEKRCHAAGKVGLVIVV